MHISAFFNGFIHVGNRFIAEALLPANFIIVFLQMINVREFMDIAVIYKFYHCLNRKSINVHSVLADKTREFLNILGSTVRVRAMQRSCPTLPADMDFRGRVAHRALRWNLHLTYRIFDPNAFWNNFIGLNDFKRTFSAQPQALNFTQITQRRPAHGRSLQLYRLKHRHRRDGRHGTGPLNIRKLRLHRLILPLEGIPGSRCMMSGHASGSRIFGIIIADDQTIHRNIHLPAFHTVSPLLNHFRECRRIRLLPVHHCKAKLLQIVHPSSPGTKFRLHIRIHMYEGKGVKLHMPFLYFGRIIQIQCTGSQVAGIGIFLVIIFYGIIDQGKIRVGYGRLTTDNHMPPVRNRLWKATDCLFQKSDIGSYGSVPSCKDFHQSAIVIGQYQRKSIQLPGQPDWPFPSPLLKFAYLLGFGQGEGRIFVGFLLTALRFITGILRRAVPTHISALLLQCSQLIKHTVPLIVGHNLILSVIVCGRCFIQPFHQRINPLNHCLVFHHDILSLNIRPCILCLGQMG